MSKNEKKKTPNCNQNPFIYKNIHLSVSTAAGITVGEEANLWQGQLVTARRHLEQARISSVNQVGTQPSPK